MTDNGALHDPWLLAAWPGMGNVAVGAVAYLLEQLGASFVHQVSGAEFFESNQVEIEQGVARLSPGPRSLFFEWKGAKSGHDLLVCLNEAQPPSGGLTLCRHVIEYAVGRGVSRVVTFAALATQIHRTEHPRVFGVATEREMLPALREFDVEILEQGQVGGLNGVLLAAGAERAVPGVCLLGELPFFAASIPNPMASMAVLDVFVRMLGVSIDFTKIRQAGVETDAALRDALEKLKKAAREQRSQGPDDVNDYAIESDESEDVNRDDRDDRDDADRLTAQDRARLESLFEAAAQDRAAAVELKEELDRLDVFDAYEGRFLDLFRRAE